MKFEITGRSFGRSDLLKYYAIRLFIMFVLYTCYWFQILKISMANLVAVCIIIVVAILRETFKTRLEVITLNSEEKNLSIRLKSWVGKVELRTIHFDDLRLEVKIPKWKRFFSTKVFFLKNKMEVWELDQKADYINDGEIEKLIDMAKIENIPMSNI